LVKFVAFFCLLNCLALAFTPFAAADEWHTLVDCKLVKEAYGDGDSFRIIHEGRELIIRLYFVDAPETNTEYPDRVRDQAEHHGKTMEEILHVGSQASTATGRLLSKPFTVITRFQDARGASSLPRYYGFVFTSENKDLGEILIANGLARSHGVVAKLKNRSAKELEDRYDRLEERARRKHVGIYSENPMRRLRMADLDLESLGPPETSGEEPTDASIPVAERETKVIAPMEVQIADVRVPTITWNDRIPGTSNPQPLPFKPMPVATSAPVTPKLPSVPTSTSVNADARINLNTATKQQLESLPGIGPALAARIIENRPFSSVADLHRVPGIGAEKIGKIHPLTTCAP